MIELKVEEIFKSYHHKKVLDGMSFVMNSGQITALIGSNGAGKTTMIKCLMKLIEPDRGQIYWNKENIRELKQKAYRVSYIPDAPIYFEQLTVLENLQFICAAYKQDESLIENIVRRLELTDFIDLLPNELSKENKQMLMIVAALLREFDILIADEPFSGLDPVQIKELKEIFLEQKEKGKVLLEGSETDILAAVNRRSENKIEQMEAAYLQLLHQHQLKEEEETKCTPF